GLVPDEIVIKIVAERLSASDCANGFILDGFPRTLNQAAALDNLLQAQGKQLDVVIEIKVDDAVVVDRISGRYMCADCGASFHDTNHKPKVPGVCDRCGSTEFIRRKDDNAETVRNRLMAYYRETSPLIGYYFAKDKLRSVDGMAPISEVSSQIEAVLANS
ncbi:MAG: nucleoside monophosphate kinase, partial [Hyphomicrobiaceae bacterium]|nr:nucleoside monophosphate kinase [Hyphomicrobiaceae bacterium]